MLQIASLVKNDWVAPKGGNISQLCDAAIGNVIAEIGHDGLPFDDMLTHARTIGGNALRQMGFHDRAKMIKAVALMLSEHKEMLYQLSYHTGATKADSMIDIDGGIATLFVFSSKGRKEMPDGQIYVDGNIEELSRDGSFKGLHVATPLLGAAVHINAFNFPVWGMLEKLAPTWLAGVPAIVKPASQGAYLTEAVVRLIMDSGLVPQGALQMIAGSAGNILDYLTPQDVVSFTGSFETAQKLKSHPNILANSIRFVAEQDSLNATLLGEDIADNNDELAVFTREITKELTTKAGQKCTAIRRILVPQQSVDAVIVAMRQKLDGIIVGDPRDENTRMGAIISLAQCADIIVKAKQISTEAELVYGTLPTSAPEKQAFIHPMLFHCKNPDSAQWVHQVEAFGPVATIMAYRDLDHAMALLNKGEGSLVASVVTQSGEIARAVTYQSAPWHGRLYFNNTQSVKASTGHGSPLPHMVHGGPGRAGGGEEMGGIRGVLHYMQRTAIQGHPNLLTAITGRYVAGADTHASGNHPFTRNYHQLEIGESITTPQRSISINDIETFAHFTGDLFYAHMDEEAAQANPFFPSRVAHGYLLLSFAAGLFVEPNVGPVLANTGLDELRFFKPVVAGDAIYVILTVKRKTRRTDEYGEIRWHVEIKNQLHEMVAQYELLTMNAYDDNKGDAT